MTGKDLKVKKQEQETIEALARRKSIDAFMRIVAVAEDEEPDDWREEWGTWRPLRVCNVKDYLRAQEIIIERAYGKAPQAVNLGDHEGGPLKVEINIVRTVAQAALPEPDYSEDVDGLT